MSGILKFDYVKDDWDNVLLIKKTEKFKWGYEVRFGIFSTFQLFIFNLHTHYKCTAASTWKITTFTCP